MINENIEKLTAVKRGHLEELVVVFERGERLSDAMTGRDLRWRIFDWRGLVREKISWRRHG